jgi:lysophospholipase L1-like esterase
MTRGIVARTSPGWRLTALIGWAAVGLSCCGGTATEGAENRPPRAAVQNSVVAFGDSITRGYGVPPGAGWVELLPGLLKKEFPEQAARVFNAGGNGNTSAEGLARIEADVLARMPGLVLIEFGGNDAVHTSRNVSVDDFERNLLAIHEAVVGRGGSVVFLTFPPVINQWHSSRSNPYYNKWGGLDQCVEQYRQRTQDVAKRLNSPLFDLDRFLRERIKAEGPDAVIARDGVHLTPAANQAIAAAVVEFLQKNDRLRPTRRHPGSK